MNPPHLSPYKEVGSVIYLSGQLAIDATGKIAQTGVAEQTAEILGKIERILEPLGLNRQHIIKTTVWLKPATDFSVFNDSYAQFFGDHRPARSTVYSDLALAAAFVEIEAIACRP
jgi:2-iminobutanoate/2-iminopropanoate deaminase